MRKELFIITTHYQLMVAIQICRMHRKENKDYEAHAVLLEYAKNALEVSDRLSQLQIFDKVIFGVINPYKGKSLFSYYRRAARCLIGLNFGNPLKNTLIHELGLDNETYEEIFFYSTTNFLVYAIHDFYCGSETVFSRFEEGVFSYNDTDTKENGAFLWELTRKIRGKGVIKRKNLLEDTKNFYCVIPALYKNSKGYCVKKVDPIDVKNIKEMTELNFVFGVNGIKEEYSPKVIFLASSIDLGDRGDEYIHEERLVKSLADKFGRENIFVKKHPRDTRGIYEEMGVKTSSKSDIPWEVIMANIESNDKLFISVASGSIIGASVIMGLDAHGYLLFPLVQGMNGRLDKYCNDSIRYIVEGLHDKDMCNNIKIVSSLDEIA